MTTAEKPSTFKSLAARNAGGRPAHPAAPRTPESRPGPSRPAPASFAALCPGPDEDAPDPWYPDPGHAAAAPPRHAAPASGAASSHAPRSQPPDPPWPHPDLPAGSHYSHEEWERAREGGKYAVFEVHTGRETALLQFERPPAPVARRVMESGKMVRREEPHPDVMAGKYLSETEIELYDGCLLLGPRALATHPGAIRNKVTAEIAHLPGWQYRVVRPATHASSRPLMEKASMIYQFKFQPGETAAYEEEGGVEAMAAGLDEAEEAASRPRMR